MPGRSGWARKGGRSSATAQCVFGGSSPSVRQSSRPAGSNRPGRTEALKRLTVATSACGSSPRARASSPIDPATTGGKAVGMNIPAGLESTIA